MADVTTLPDLTGFKNRDLLMYYKQTKDEVERLEQSIRDKAEKLKIKQNHLKAEIKRRMVENGEDQIKVVGAATAFWKKNTKVSVTDWSATFDHLTERLAQGDDPASIFSAFEKRITLDYVMAYAGTHDGIPPPGTNYMVENELIVRVDNKSEPGA